MILFEATVENVGSRADRTWKIVLGTQDLGAAKIAEVATLAGKLVYVAVKIESFAKEETDILKELKADYDGPSWSKRLRNTIFVLWEQNKETSVFKTFDTFYAHHMESLITHYKLKLKPL